MKSFGMAALAGVLAAGLFTAADTKPAGAQDLSALSGERRAIMRSNGGNLGKARAGDAAAIRRLAANALKLSAPALWAKGSGGPDTRARDAIWENFDDFKVKLANFKNAADAAVAALGGGDAAAAAAKIVGTCNACHRPYRF